VGCHLFLWVTWLGLRQTISSLPICHLEVHQLLLGTTMLHASDHERQLIIPRNLFDLPTLRAEFRKFSVFVGPAPLSVARLQCSSSTILPTKVASRLSSQIAAFRVDPPELHMIRACRIRRLGKTLDWWSANARLRTRAAEFVQAHTIASGFSQSHVFSQEFVWSAPTEVSNTIAGRFAREPCRLQSSRSAGRSEVYEPKDLAHPHQTVW
jgi:hypothetical protein